MVVSFPFTTISLSVPTPLVKEKVIEKDLSATIRYILHIIY